MNKIVIVDDNDSAVGTKERVEIDYKKDIYRSAALWILNSNNDVLIAQRKLTKRQDPGKWGPSVSGTVDEGEDYDSNIYKEADEEVGLKGYTFEKLEKIRYYEPHPQFVQWYKVAVDEPLEYFTPQPEEVEKIEWVALPDLIKDVKENPEKYIASMGSAVALLEKSV